MSAWDSLLNRALAALDHLDRSGTPLRRWALGGGTALMLHHQHRDSKDIDLFIDDPQYLGLLSPRLNNAFDIDEIDYEEAAHYLKVRFPEGEIDVIVASSLGSAPHSVFSFQGREIAIETPAEIALKKLYYRPATLKPRDIFDVAVVLTTGRSALIRDLSVLSPVKPALEMRLSTLSEPFLQLALDGLDIFQPWEWLKASARPMVSELVSMIPRTEP